jgi:tRNA pseudouridine-54 N-methylase
VKKVLVEAVTGSRTLVLVANHARPEPDLPLDDLPGLGGRFDLVARFVNAALLTSHGIREDTDAIVVFTQPGEPLAIRVRGDEVTGVGPDERSTAARLLGALEATPMPVWQAVAEGIELRTGALSELLTDLADPLVLVHGDGEPLAGDRDAGTFVIGDHAGFTQAQRDRLVKQAEGVASLGSTALQADHVAAVLHHELDR